MPDGPGCFVPCGRQDHRVMARRILIIGGSSTLGRATARVLEAEPPETHLWLTHHPREDDRELRAQFPGAVWTKLDLKTPSDVTELFQMIAREWRSLDGVVISAGVGFLRPVLQCSDEQLTELFQINVLASFQIIRHAYPLLFRGTHSAVVLFSSTMGLVGAAGMVGYAASKAAVANLTRSLAIEWAPQKIRVNAVAPGVVPSPLVAEMFAKLSPEQVEEIRRRHPLGFGDPKDVAFAVQFLLSEKARWITGVVLPVDGGYTAQ